MSATLVQEKATTGANVTSLAAALTSGTTSGNGLIACITLSSTGGGNSNITAPAGWSLAVSVSPVTRARVAIYYLENCGSGLTSFTFTFSTAADVSIHLQERANILTSSSLDVTASATSTTATSTTGTTPATAQADELVVWCLGYADSTALTYSGLVGTYTADALNTMSTTGAPQANLAVWYNETSATGTQNSGVTMSAIPSGDAHASGAVIACFKVSGATAHSLEVETRGNFFSRASLQTETRDHFLTALVGKVQSRSTFKLAVVAKVQAHDTFALRATLSPPARAKFVTRTALSVVNRARFLLSNGLKVGSRVKTLLRAGLAGPSHAKFANRTRFQEQARGHFLLRSPLAVAARSTFKLASGVGHALGVSLRSHFLTRQTSRSQAHAAFSVRTPLALQSRSHFLLRFLAQVQSHARFLAAMLAHASARVTFPLKVGLHAATRSTFLLSYRLALGARATFKLAVGVGHLLRAGAHVVFVARTGRSTPTRAQYRVRGSGLGTTSRVHFAIRSPVGRVLARAKYSLSGRLASTTRAAFLSQHTQQVAAHVSFATRTWFRQFPRVVMRVRTVLSPSARAGFAVRTSLASRARVRFLSRAMLALRSQSHAFTRATLALPGRTRFRLLLVLHVPARTLSRTRAGLKDTAHAVFEVRQALAAVAQDTFKLQSAPSLPLVPTFQAVGALASSFAAQNALSTTYAYVQYTASFIRSPSVANPNSTTTVTCTLKDKLGNLVSTASAVSVTVTFPDGSTQTFSQAGSTVSNLGQGQYAITYLTKSVGEILEDWSFTAADGVTKLEAHNVTPVTY